MRLSPAMLLTLDTFTDKGNHDLEPRPEMGSGSFRIWPGSRPAPTAQHPALYTTAQEALASRPAPVRVVGINSGSESMDPALLWHGVLSSDGKLTMGTQDKAMAHCIAASQAGSVAVASVRFKSREALQACLTPPDV